MTTRELIFSDSNKYRITRHVAGWFLFILFSFYTDIEINYTTDLARSHTYWVSLMRVLCYFPTYFLMVYIFLEVLIPRFIQVKKYLKFFLGAFLTFTICYIINLVSSFLFVWLAYNFHIPAGKLPQWCLLLDWNMTIQRGGFLCGSVTLIKLARIWYLQQKETTRLARQEADHKMWLFRSKVQPEFLLYSLQGLHQKIKSDRDEASGMILHLSDVFSYILYESNVEEVLLEKELNALYHLVTTEKMCEEGDGGISLHVRGNVEGKYITPLTLFSYLRDYIADRSRESNLIVNIDVAETYIDLSLVQKKCPAGDLEHSADTYSRNNNLNQLPANFNNYNIHKNDIDNSFLITAKIELLHAGVVPDHLFKSIKPS